MKLASQYKLYVVEDAAHGMMSSFKVKHNERHSGQSNYTLFESIKFFLKLATGFSIFSLRLTSLSGAIISLIGFLLSFYYIVECFIFKIFSRRLYNNYSGPINSG